MADTGRQTGGETLERTKLETREPTLFKVILHNDDYTTMDFVVYILVAIFNRSDADAVEIMLHVHRNGLGVAGIYTREIAETRVGQVEILARQCEYPLRCSIEEA